MKSTITTAVERFCSSHNVIELTTVVMNITVRDASHEPDLYKNSDVGDQMNDLVKFILTLDGLRRTPSYGDYQSIINALQISFKVAMENRPVILEDRAQVVRAFNAYISGISAIFALVNDNSKPADCTSIINQINNDIK